MNIWSRCLPVWKKVLAEVYGRYGIKEIGPLGNSVFLLTLTSDPGPQVVADLIHGDVRFKAVQPNLIYRIKQPGKKAE